MCERDGGLSERTAGETDRNSSARRRSALVPPAPLDSFLAEFKRIGSTVNRTCLISCTVCAVCVCVCLLGDLWGVILRVLRLAIKASLEVLQYLALILSKDQTLSVSAEFLRSVQKFRNRSSRSSRDINCVFSALFADIRARTSTCEVVYDLRS